MTAVKTRLTNIKLADLENMVGKERDRKLYEELKTRLKAFGNDPQKLLKKSSGAGGKTGGPVRL